MGGGCEGGYVGGGIWEGGYVGGGCEWAVRGVCGRGL